MLTDNLLRFNKKQKYLCMDFETYNLNLCGYGNVPWQCSFVIVDQNKIHEEHDLYVDWGREPCDFIKEMTGYSARRMKSEGLQPEEAYKYFNKYFRDPEYIIVGHNILGLDIPLERLWAKAIGYDHKYDYLDRVIDTLCLAKSYRFDRPPDKKDFLKWQFKISKEYTRNMKCKLSDLGKEFEIDFDPTMLHNSIYDVKLNVNVLKQLLWKVEL